MQYLHLLMILLVLFHPSNYYLQLVKSKSTQKLPPQPQYHMGPVLSKPINLYIIWYGKLWTSTQKSIIRDFINSFSNFNPSKSKPQYPLVSQWWATVTLYDDQTDANVTKTISLAKEFIDPQSTSLTRLSMQQVIKNAVVTTKSLPLDYTSGLYLVLTSKEVLVHDFCGGSVCGFHSFTFPSVVGAILPYAWVGNSESQCPGMCAFPFAWDKNLSPTPPQGLIFKPPNRDVGIDGMINVIAHELAEAASDPLANAWYAGGDPTAPTEICDLCIGMFGTGGGGGGYLGTVYNEAGRVYNLIGVNDRKFLVQWVWNRVLKSCYGPNALKRK